MPPEASSSSTTYRSAVGLDCLGPIPGRGGRVVSEVVKPISVPRPAVRGITVPTARIVEFGPCALFWTLRLPHGRSGYALPKHGLLKMKNSRLVFHEFLRFLIAVGAPAMAACGAADAASPAPDF